MDFEFTPEQDEAAALAARILTDHATPARMQAVEATGSRFDPELWRAMGEAGLLGLAVPEEHGGAGLGLLELCRVVVEAGRTVAPVPLATHGATALVLSALGTDDQRARWLPAAAAGTAVLTAAVAEDRAHLPGTPTTSARRTGAGWQLDGVKTIVPAGPDADLLVVPAATAEGTGLFLVEPGDAGVRVEEQWLSDGDTVGRVTLSGAVLADDRLLGGSSASDVVLLHQLLLVTAAAQQLGVAEGALRLTAAYAKQREQFGRPIGTFQAVSQRLADGYIDTLGQSLTLWQAAWRLVEGLPADVEVATAKLWAADAGHRIAHTCVHVHGGVGIDLDGEAHRYFTAAKRFELTYGGATEQALAIGRSFAAEDALSRLS